MDSYMRAIKKAELLSGGPIHVSKHLTLPFPLSKSTAGPGAGSASLVIEFEGIRVKKAVTWDDEVFSLNESGGNYFITKNGKPFLDKVCIGHTLAHAPEQAFFNLATECIYNCKFCTSPSLKERGATKSLTDEKIISMIMHYSEHDDLKAVALTSAVISTPQDTIDRMSKIVKDIREKLPLMPIGVEPYVEKRQQIEQLKAAGADEIKLNIETYDKSIFEKVCGEQDIDQIIENIISAVEIFGRGKVTSNIIYGMGETDENVLAGCEYLASLGCVATLRPLRLNDLNRPQMEAALGHLEPVNPERMVKLAQKYKQILIKYDLTTFSFKTMCHECTCCDIVPFRDI
ncbi:radical SAM protein [Candidatus Methanomassiliicoccus intestinalis]|uniref:radical SAM protein n=1 Tax=Candidatus Methanomassiliicoccus intestinalis TaxID=1406512 RepID=UPI0037DDA92A